MIDIDDLKRRAEGVGIKMTYASSGVWKLINSDDKLWTLFFQDDPAGLQAAEDIIAAEEKRQACPDCEGRKTKPYFNMRDIKADLIEYLDCPTCNGTGKRKESTNEPS